MKKVLILKGLPASGKSTYARELLLKEKGRWVRVNKDLLRKMCHDSHWSKHNEKFIIQLRNTIILMALEEGKHVIVDDTNFSSHIEQIKQLVQGKAKVKVDDSFLKVPVEECIKRDLKRLNSVGKDVIMNMYNQFVRQDIPPVEYNPELEDAIIVDLDGTLAIIHDRSPFDVSKCHQDLPNKPVLETVYKWQDSIKIIAVSGRTDDGKELTEKWLRENRVNYTALHMRKMGDMRKDSIIKQEIYEELIRDQYNIKFVLDDRNQVVKMWRDLGLTVFQVAEGNF